MARKMNLVEKKTLKAEQLSLFMRQYGRRKGRNGHAPNDRSYDRELEQAIKRMPPEELDAFLRYGDE